MNLFSSFVLSETTDHGSSKCDRWVDFLLPQILIFSYKTSDHLLSVFVFCFSVRSGTHQQQRWRRHCAEGEGEGQRRDVLEGDQRRHGLDQLGAGEGQCLRNHQLHHPEVLPYSRDQDCQSAADAEILTPPPPPRVILSSLHANQQRFLLQPKLVGV